MAKLTEMAPKSSTATVTPAIAAKRRVMFKLTAPEAHEVFLSGSFNDWSYTSTPLKKDASGVWKTQVSLAPGTYEYRFVVDGQWRDDPECPLRVENSFGSQNCVRIV